MRMERRGLLKQGVVMASAVLLGKNVWDPQGVQAQEGVPPELARFDLYTVYRQMFSSTANDAKCCWWYLGSSKASVPDIGDVPTNQVETCMIYKTEDQGPNSVKVYWKEIGVFRDIVTGELPGPWLNPETGKLEPRHPSFEDGPAHYTISRRGAGIHIDLDQARARVQSVTAHFTFQNGQVCLTQVEDKIRAFGAEEPSPIRTVLKIYASLSDLQDTTTKSVKSSGFYASGRNPPGPIGLSVNGLMQKAAIDEKLNPIGWERMRKAYPAFFKDDRVDPPWN